VDIFTRNSPILYSLEWGVVPKKRFLQKKKKEEEEKGVFVK
jgi:hypothetical protein